MAPKYLFKGYIRETGFKFIYNAFKTVNRGKIEKRKSKSSTRGVDGWRSKEKNVGVVSR